MLRVTGLFKAYGTQDLFDGITFTLAQGERLGLVGRNGSGKSTLLKLILGEEQPDDGHIHTPKGYITGHLAQHLNFTESTVLDEACLGLREEERDQTYRAEIILNGLGFSETDLGLSPHVLSGGFQIRVNLARLLLSEPNLLLLDEPTNYLDIVSTRWIVKFLRAWRGEMIVISHDRDFMDSVTTHTMAIYRKSVRKVPGGTQKLYDQIMLDEEVYEKTRLNEEKKRRDMEAFINRFRAQASKATLVQSRIKALERMGTKEELSQDQTLDFEFRSKPFSGKYPIEARDIHFSYPKKDDADPPELISALDLVISKNDRIGVIGKNGRGKSTLLKLLAGELKPTSGQLLVHSNSALGYFGQTNINRLNHNHTIEEEITQENNSLSRTAVRNICGTMMFGGDLALKKISVLSGGERSRVLLGKILAHPSNLLLLDEPTNHLDMDSIDALIESMKIYDGAIVIVTHSELILRELATRLVVFRNGPPIVFDGGYDYFLEKLGWEEEEGERTSGVKKGKQSSPSAMLQPDKFDKAKTRKEKSIELKPVEREIERIEKKIIKLEKELKDGHDLIIQKSQSGDASDLGELSRSMKRRQAEIEKFFEDLDELSQKASAIKAKYE